MTLPTSGPISMSQVNTELGRSSTATIQFSDPIFRTMGNAAGANVELAIAHDNGQVGGTDYSNVTLSAVYGRRCRAFQVSGTGAYSGTAPNRTRSVGWSASIHFGAVSGDKPAWVSEAFMTEFEPASSSANYFFVTGSDNGVGQGANAGRSIWIGGGGVVGVGYGQG